MGTSRQIVINGLERASSSLQLRGFQFAATVLGALMAGLYDDHRWPVSYPGLSDGTTATETPLRAHVVSGLLVQPDNVGYLTITPGVLLACITPTSADDSVMQEVLDPGVSDPATLTFTANASGQVRLDIVECQVVSTVVEQATVPIFDEGTRVFTPTPSQARVREPRLSYRVRVGTPGGGLPAAAAGWLPLAVINVQSGAAGFSTCEVWDVRPLLADRVFDNEPVLQPDGLTVRAVRAPLRGVASLQGSQAGAENGVRGWIETAFNGYKAGGEIRCSVAVDPGNFGAADYDSNFLLNGSHLQAAGAWTPAANKPYFYAVVFPGGLPRWVKYTQDPDAVAGARVPRGPRGILVLTTTQPNAGGYYSALTPPAVCGFTAAAPGVMLAAALFSSAPAQMPWSMRGNEIYTPGTAASAVLGGKAGASSAEITWTFNTTNSGFPANAVSLILDINCSNDVHAVGTVSVHHKSGVVAFTQQILVSVAGAVSRVVIPLWSGEVNGADTGDQIVKLAVAAGSDLAADAVIAGFVFA